MMNEQRYSSTRRNRVLLCRLASSLVLLSMAYSFHAAELEECREITFPAAPTWVTSGVWLSTTPETVLWLDLVQQNLQTVSADGSQEKRVLPGRRPAESKLGLAEDFYASIVRGERGIYIQKFDRSDSSKNSILLLDEELQAVESFEYPSYRFGEERIGALYSWFPLSEGILAYGSLRSPDADTRVRLGQIPRGWTRAFFYFDSSGNIEVFRRLPLSDKTNFHYLHQSMPFLAATSGRGYILFLDEEPRIGEVMPGRRGVRGLSNFPTDFQRFPQVGRPDPWYGPRHETTVFLQALERSHGAAGLYASESEGLFLLAKGAIEEEGKTPWWMIRIDPNDGSELFRKRMPTDAPNLTILPGERHWAFVQKAAVEPITEAHAPFMRISSMVLVPAAWLDAEDTGPLSASERAYCSF